MTSLTEAAKAVLEGKSKIDEGYGINYPSVGNGGVSNPNPVDPDRKSTRLNSSHVKRSRMPSSA